MGDTAKLLRLYRIDQQLDGLKSRLTAAERYLAGQSAKLKAAEERLTSLRSQGRQLEATAHNDETEIKALDERIELIRDRMNKATTSKEHSAMLVEISTLKNDRSAIEERALASMSASDEVKKQIGEVQNEIAEITKIREVAQRERDEREAEIKDRVSELEAERQEALSDVPTYALEMYKERLTFGIDEVMSPVVEQDRRNMEYTCEVSNTVLPVELVNKLLSKGTVVTCPVSDAILYMPDDLRESLETAAEKKRKRREVTADKD
jgi:predicted  nucleic acid-binding Zn-ribbon protein